MESARSRQFEEGVRELAEAERATVSLAERLAASVGGEPVALTLRDGSTVLGTVTDATRAWVLLGRTGREEIVPLAAVASARGVVHQAAPLGEVASRLGLGHALRALARDGATVVVVTMGGEVRGRIDQVGADHVDVAADGAGSIVVPFGEILAVRSVR